MKTYCKRLWLLGEQKCGSMRLLFVNSTTSNLQKKEKKILCLTPIERFRETSLYYPEITGCRIEFKAAESEFIFTSGRPAAWNFKT